MLPAALKRLFLLMLPSAGLPELASAAPFSQAIRQGSSIDSDSFTLSVGGSFVSSGVFTATTLTSGRLDVSGRRSFGSTAITVSWLDGLDYATGPSRSAPSRHLLCHCWRRSC